MMSLTTTKELRNGQRGRHLAAGAALGAALLTLLPALAAARTITPASILGAERNLTYQGLLLIDGRQRVRVLRGGGGRERQEFLDRAGQIQSLVISDGHVRWQYAPDLHIAQVQPTGARGTLGLRLTLLKRNYRFQPMGESQRAGRPVMLVRFVPRFPGNLMHLLWVDQDTALPLAVERRERDGHLVDRSEFLSIRYHPPVPTGAFNFQIPEGVRVMSAFTILAHGSASTPLPPSLHFAPPRRLPPGYALLSWRYFKSSGQVPTLDWHYHDGLNPLSLFAVPADEKAPLPPEARRVNLDGKPGFFLDHDASEMLTWMADGASYTLVGHLPAPEMMQVAESTF